MKLACWKEDSCLRDGQIFVFKNAEDDNSGNDHEQASGLFTRNPREQDLSRSGESKPSTSPRPESAEVRRSKRIKNASRAALTPASSRCASHLDTTAAMKKPSPREYQKRQDKTIVVALEEHCKRSPSEVGSDSDCDSSSDEAYPLIRPLRF